MNNNKNETKNIFEEEYDITITNPPFGSKCKFDTDMLNEYDKKLTLEYIDKTKIPKKMESEFFFTVQSVNNSNVSCLLLPDSVLCNQSFEKLRKQMFEKHTLNGVISFGEDIFNGSTKVKTSLLILEKNKTSNQKVFMGMGYDYTKDKYSSTDKEYLESVTSSYVNFIKENEL